MTTKDKPILPPDDYYDCDYVEQHRSTPVSGGERNDKAKRA